MPIQETITGERNLIGNTVTIQYNEEYSNSEFISQVEKLIRDPEREHEYLVKIENKLGRADAHYKAVEPVKATEEYFIYEVTENTFKKLSSVNEFDVDQQRVKS